MAKKRSVELPLPEEPIALKRETRAFLEASPEEGARRIRDARFLAEPLWEAWGDALRGAGMGHDRFLEVARGYSGEIRLWVVGERIWAHCAAGLSGRLLRRLPAASAESGVGCDERDELLTCTGVAC
jgi:hypothetical protein